MLFRFPVQESWCELMEAMSSVAKGATGVILAMAGQVPCPEEVRLFIQSAQDGGESAVPIISAAIVFELLIVKKQRLLVVSLPLYIQLSAHLQSPQEDISMELFTKVLRPQASELSERLVTQPTRPSVLGRLHSSCFDGGYQATAEVLCCPLSSSTQTPKHPHCQ
eukprot:Em0009g389a